MQKIRICILQGRKIIRPYENAILIAMTSSSDTVVWPICGESLPCLTHRTNVYVSLCSVKLVYKDNTNEPVTGSWRTGLINYHRPYMRLYARRQHHTFRLNDIQRAYHGRQLPYH